MALQPFYQPSKFVCNDIYNVTGLCTLQYATLPYITNVVLPASRYVQRSYSQFILAPGQQGVFKGIAFQGINSATVTGSTTVINNTGSLNYNIFTGPRLRAAIMDTDNPMWLDNTNNTSLPRTILATMSSGTTWAQAAQNTVASGSSTSSAQMFGFLFDNPVYLTPGLYWIQLLAETFFPTNGAGVYTGSDQNTPLLSTMIASNGIVPYNLINRFGINPLLWNTYEGNGTSIGINQLTMNSNLNLTQTGSYLPTQNGVTGFTGRLIFGTSYTSVALGGSNASQGAWTQFLWRQ